jgi:hypothetical protein
MYVHLISTASSEQFDNELSSFTVALSPPLHLEGRWEVALIDALIPYNIDMLRGQECVIDCISYQRNADGQYDPLGLVHTGPLKANLDFCGFSISYHTDHYEVRLRSTFLCTFAGESYGLPNQIFGDTGRVIRGSKIAERKLSGEIQIDLVRCSQKSVSIRSGYYTEFKDLVLELNNVIGEGQFEIDKNSGFFKFVGNKDVSCVFQLSDKLGNVIGFRGESLQPLQSNTAKHLPDRYPGFHAFILQSNCVENSHVGHVRAPLLQILPLKNNMRYGELMHYEISNAHYKKVTKTDISVLHTSIFNDVGEKIRFGDRGHVILTLHFRQI